MIEERWRKIDKLPGYEVSDHGRMRSVDRTLWCTNRWRHFKGRNLATHLCPRTGYPKAHIMGKTFYIHRLVAAAFLEPPLPSRREVNHKNGNRADPHYSNLEWMTHAENTKHSFQILGRRPSALGKFGRANPGSKPITAVCLHTGETLSFGSLSEAEKDGRFSKTSVNRACQANGVYRGYRWKHAESSASVL